MRAYAWFFAAALAGCRPSATVERTMPVANLNTYRTVGLRVQSSAFASQGQAMMLENAVLQNVQHSCSFTQVTHAGSTPADVVLDLNITNTGRGGSGWIKNQNEATIDTLLVLSDGQSGELLGTARIHGSSSGMIINNSVPENEAIDAVAKSVGELLAKSGCFGPRVAKAEAPAPTPDPPATGSGATPDNAKRHDAEQLNEQGKEKLRGADIAGALAAFQQANTLVPDARYEYNVCLAYEAQEKWSNAIEACKQARAMKPEARLVAKIDHRLELLKNRQ